MCDTRFFVGEWLVNASANSISREGRECPLPPRLTDLLKCFVEHRGSVVSREMLVESVWHRAFVTDQAINQSVFELRKALRDGRSANDCPNYIQTIPKRGYRLVADVEILSEEMSPPAPDPASAPSAVATPAAGLRTAPAAADLPTAHTDMHPGDLNHQNTSSAPASAATSASSASAADDAHESVGSRLASFARGLWLNESALGFKKTLY